AVEPEPAQLAPLLGPVVDEESRIREDEEVLDTGELPRVLGSLRLVVERTVDPRMAARRVLADDETDRHEAGPAARGDRRQRRGPGRTEECPLIVGQDRGTRLGHRRTVAPVSGGRPR